MTSITSTPSNTCDESGERFSPVALSSFGSGNNVTIDTSVGAMEISNIALATAAQMLGPVRFDVLIDVDRWSSDHCGNRYLLDGAQVTFTARVVNLNAGGSVQETFDWTMPGGSHRDTESVT